MNKSTRFGSIKQEIPDLKNEVSTLQTKNIRVNTMENSMKTIISDQVSESIRLSH